MLDWLRKLFIGEKGVASTPEVVTPVQPTVSQEEVDKLNKETQKIVEEATKAQEPKPEPKKEWTKAQKPGIKKKPAPKPQSTAATKSRAVKAKTVAKPKTKS